MKQCANCVFYQVTRATQGFCKRYPPQLVRVDGFFSHQAVWPMVVDDDLCGEHVQKSK